MNPIHSNDRAGWVDLQLTWVDSFFTKGFFFLVSKTLCKGISWFHFLSFLYFFIFQSSFLLTDTLPNTLLGTIWIEAKTRVSGEK